MRITPHVNWCWMLVAAAITGCNHPEKDTTVAESVDLSSYQWQNRLLILCGPKPEGDVVRACRAEWDARRPGLTDRDIIIMMLYEDRPGSVDQMEISAAAAGELRRRLAVPPAVFTLLLIGKDGQVKLRSETPVPPDEVFDLIDAMPMRQSEMRKRGRQGNNSE